MKCLQHDTLVSISYLSKCSEVLSKAECHGLCLTGLFSFQNRKNDEASYEKMLKLRRDLNRACTILDMVKRRESSKKELLKLTVDVFEKR